jgi:hypothetical protein
MILGEAHAPPTEAGDGATLDELLHVAAARRPDAIALGDPPNRADFTYGEPRCISYAEADHIASAIAGRLRRLALPIDAVVALQLPNTIESALALLGVLRAGLIAAPLPLLWRRADATAALERVGAKAIITTSRVGETNLCGLAMNVAAEIFPIRYVFSFGPHLPDGVIPLNDLLGTTPLLEPHRPVTRQGNPAAHVAIITFESTPGGLMPVCRSHMELVAGGQAVLLEARLQENASILASCGIASFAALATGLVPWLLAGGTLSLHHPFDPTAFAEQCLRDRCDTVALPGPLASRLVHAGLLTHPELRNVLALWRAPERLSIGAPWPHPQANLVDVLAFGETGLIAGCRGIAGQPAPIPLGPVRAPRDAADASAMVETAVTETGTLALRGAMVPRHPFPPSAENDPRASFKADAHGFADTLYACRADSHSGEIAITAPPPGIVSVGGYRFRADKLHELVAGAGGDATLTALPDALAGHRLAGSAADREAVRHALEMRGVNSLISGAFVERRRANAA